MKRNNGTRHGLLYYSGLFIFSICLILLSGCGADSDDPEDIIEKNDIQDVLQTEKEPTQTLENVEPEAECVYRLRDESFRPLYCEEKDETYILKNGFILDGVITGRINREEMSLDGSVYAAVTWDNALYLAFGESLYLLTEKSGGHELAAFGDMFAYIDENAENALYLVDIGKGEISCVDTNVDLFMLAVSPHGESIAYVNEQFDLTVYREGQKYRIANGATPISVSDSGEYIYYESSENEFWCASITGENNNLTAQYATNEFMWVETHLKDINFILNDSHTQIIFECNNEKTYFADKGKIIAELPYKRVRVASPVNVESHYGMENDMTYGVESLYFTMLLGDGDAFYLEGNGEAVPLECDLYVYDRDDKGTLYYIDYGKEGILYRLDDELKSKTTKIADNVKRFVISDDGKEIYYIDYQECLWYKYGNREAKKIAEGSSIGCSRIINGYCLFQIYMDEECVTKLYCIKNGENIVELCSDISDFGVFENNAYYIANYEYPETGFFVSTNGIEFEAIAKNVEID